MATLFVGNLSLTTTDADLLELFTPHGEVTSASVSVDRNTNRSRGFALVEMTSGADVAMRAVNGKAVGGRRLSVTAAQPRIIRPSPLVNLHN